MKNILIIITSLSIASVGLSATKRQERTFATGDADQNGSISQAEFIAAKSEAAKANAEKKNQEFKAKQTAKRLAKQFAKSDTDGDGKLSAEEFYQSFAKKKESSAASGASPVNGGLLVFVESLALRRPLHRSPNDSRASISRKHPDYEASAKRIR